MHSSPRKLVVICSLLLLASFGTGPFYQQTVGSTPCDIVDPVQKTPVWAPNILDLPDDYYADITQSYELEPSVKAAILKGLSALPYSNELPSIREDPMDSSCPTGDCTFPRYNGIAYSSIGLYYDCTNISALVTLTYDDPDEMGGVRWQLPNHLTVHRQSNSSYEVFTNVTTRFSDWEEAEVTSEDHHYHFLHPARMAYANVTILTLSDDYVSSCRFESETFCTFLLG